MRIITVQQRFKNLRGFPAPFPALFRSRQVVPPLYHTTFRRLYADIGWFGVLNGSTLAFLTIYATRIGADAGQIGLISAAPALVILMLSLPSGILLEKRETGPAVFWSALLHRLFYLFLVPLPLLFASQVRIWMLILCIFLMNIPGSILSLGFNALFAEAVPQQWRGHVVGVRNAVFAITTTLTTLLCGWILRVTDFPAGYQIVFAIGFLGAAFSTLNLFLLRTVKENPDKPVIPLGLPANREESAAMNIHRIRPWSRLFQRIRDKVHPEVLKGSFGRVLILLSAFHLAQYLPIPLFPVYQVNTLELSDQTLSMGTAVFNLSIFIFSTQLARISNRFGNQKTTGMGLVLLSLYPFLIAVAKGAELYLVANFISGAAWAFAGGALYNYLLEKVPAESRPTYLAWFTLGVNACVLAGSLLGPLVAVWMPMTSALFLFGVFRALVGLVIIRWG